MKKRMLALLLTLCLVFSLLPAQSVVAEGGTATVTILGNSKTVTLCDSNGVAVAGPDLELTVSIPVGSSLGAEGYSIVFAVEDGDPLGWTVHPNTALETTAEVLAYTINGDTTFEPGWPGAGGGDEEPEPQYNMGFVTEADALFIVYPVDGEPWNTNGFADYVEAGKTLRDTYADLSVPTHQSDFNKHFDGWMVCTQDPDTGMYEQIPGSQILGLTEALDYPASDAYITYFVAQWRIEVPEPIDLGTISLDTPFDVDISFFPGQTSTAVADFTPAETGYYMVTKTSNGWQSISANLEGTEISGESWYGDAEEGMRWKMDAGKTYQIVFDGSTNGPITYTMKKVPAPTAIAFYETSLTAYLGDIAVGVYDVVFTPAEAYADVEITYADADFVEKNENDRYIYKKLGTSTVTATCGTLTVTAEVTVEEALTLPLNETVTHNTGSRSWLKYSFTPAESGEYTFDFRADNDIACSVDGTDSHWSVLGGGRNTYVVTLEGGKTYTVWAGEASNVDIAAKVTKGNDWLTLTETSPLALNIPARSTVTAVFDANASSEHILHWAKTVKLDSLGIRVKDTQNGYVGEYTGDYEMLYQTLESVGLKLEMMANEKYIITVTNMAEEAMAFALNIQPAVLDTKISFEDPHPNGIISIGNGTEAHFQIVPVNPAGVLDTISWESSDESVVKVSTGDNTNWGLVTLIGEGEATVTATNAANGEKATKTLYVVDFVGPNLILDGNGGSFVMNRAEKPFTTTWFGFQLPADKNMGITELSDLQDPKLDGREFAGWQICYGEGGEYGYENAIPVSGKDLLSSAEAEAYKAEDGKRVILLAQWKTAPKDYYPLALDGYHGDGNYGGKMTLPDGDGSATYQTTFRVWEWAEEGQTLADATGLSALSDPTWENFTFEGWLKYREDGDPFQGPCILSLESQNLISSADLLDEVVPDYMVRYVAKWAEIDWSYYESIYDPYFGGGEGGEQGFANVEVNANFGEVFVHGADVSAGAHDINVEPGKSMADVGEKFDDPVYWANRAFLGWIVTTVEELTDEDGNTYWDDVQIPGTKLMTTAEMLAYKTPADGTRIKFVAQWAGDDSDYFSDVGFETLDGILTMLHPDGNTDETTAPGQRCRKNGSKLSQQIEWSIPNDPVHPEFKFEGWLEYNEEEGMILVSETIYTTAQVFAMTVPSYNVRFVAKWDGISMDEYKSMFQNAEDSIVEIPEIAVDEALENIEDGTVILNAVTSDATEEGAAVVLSADSVEKLVAADVEQVVIEMNGANVTLDTVALQAIAEQAEGAAIILAVEVVEEATLSEEQQDALADQDVALVLTALILSDGEPIGDFKGGSITVAVPFELPAGDNAEDYNVWYVANDGTMEKMDTSYADGMLFFITKHFSDYVVIKTTLTDEEDKDNSGVGESTPEPEDPTQPTEPKPTEPKPTEPKPTEPKPTEPKPTEPKPTEPTKPTNPAVPDTADTADIMGLMTLMLASGAMAMALWLSLRKRNAA